MKDFKIKSYRHEYEYKTLESIDLITKHLLDFENLDLIFVDSKVFDNHKQLKNLNPKKVFLIDVLPETKSISKLEVILKVFIKFNLNKNSFVAIIGGATLQDIVASACCLYHRGIKWIFVPTTGLSQGDSCIGSKTSIDGEGSKNQYGVFYPPSLILSCKQFLFTLPIIEIYSGLGDILHYVAPYQKSKFFINNILQKFKNRDHLVNSCHNLSFEAMSIKAELVEIDEFDQSQRAIFNFGHTFGHALEKSTKEYLPHGIAVLIGIYIALDLNKSQKSKVEILNQKLLIENLLKNILTDMGLKNFHFSKKEIFDNLKKDKKNDSFHKIKCILPVDINDSEWISKKLEPIYGLKKFNLSINECLTAVNQIANLENVFLTG